MSITQGTRIKCTTCASEAIVLQSKSPELTCCDKPVEEIFTPDGPPQPGA